jgi:hypothetical protein
VGCTNALLQEDMHHHTNETAGTAAARIFVENNQFIVLSLAK